MHNEEFITHVIIHEYLHFLRAEFGIVTEDTAKNEGETTLLSLIVTQTMYQIDSSLEELIEYYYGASRYAGYAQDILNQPGFSKDVFIYDALTKRYEIGRFNGALIFLVSIWR